MRKMLYNEVTGGKPGNYLLIKKTTGAQKSIPDIE